MINLNEWLADIDTLEPGQTIRKDHVNCPAGEDTRQRLYITRQASSPDVVLGYCHNCQESGVFKEDYQQYRDAPTPTSTTTSVVTPPPNLVFDTKLWPTNARTWLYGKASRIAGTTVTEAYIGYDPSTDRIYLPSFTPSGTLIGYQLRDINNREPKYITVRKKGAPSYTSLHHEVVHSLIHGTGWQVACIVEDLISGYVLYNLGMDAFVTHGTNVDPVLMYTIATHYDEAIVWLDNDNHHVCTQAKTMARTLSMYSPSIKVTHIEYASDPKNYTDKQIEEALNGQH